ncbi:universal stress protein [Bacillus sp. HMF5848]|uniref:universal stress protein n=1 Tax=Bacillus sp. HMF5848 TaxID=2495421 RepID=UPI000F778C31|nr:universal stress protein [Bacillus sp. HMF5848]RSK25631.1 universal stress protein [Bacillus sp. HMF5848]
MYEKILLAYDGSEHSLRASEKAIGLAKLNADSKITLVYVVDISKAKSDVLHNWNSLHLSDSREEKIRKAESIIKKENIQYEVKLLKGEPGPAIVEFANSERFDVVVVGSRGLNSLQEMVLGSVSHKIAKRVSCPVLIVK